MDMKVDHNTYVDMYVAVYADMYGAGLDGCNRSFRCVGKTSIENLVENPDTIPSTAERNKAVRIS